MCNHLAQLNHEIVPAIGRAHLKGAEAGSSGIEDPMNDPVVEGMSPDMPFCDWSQDVSRIVCFSKYCFCGQLWWNARPGSRLDMRKADDQDLVQPSRLVRIKTRRGAPFRSCCEFEIREQAAKLLWLRK
jgi:hypothetical protein